MLLLVHATSPELLSPVMIIGYSIADRAPGEQTHWIYSLLAALILLVCFAPSNSSAEEIRAERPPNIVFILADDLGYGDLGCNGQTNIQTPRIDQLAREGMRFTNFYAGSTVCAPSRCVLMTGYHTGHAWIRGNAKIDLRPEDVTVAEVLSKAGYRTGLIGKWGLGHEGSAGVPNEQGFDYFYGYLDQHHAHNYYPAFLHRNQQRVPLANVVPGPEPFGSGVATTKVQYSHDLLMEEAYRFVEQSADQPFFLYLALTIPHANNEAGKRGMEVPDYGPYADRDWPDTEKGHAAMITRMDRDIGQLLDQLERLGIADQTLVIFSSDNGPHREAGHDPEFHNSNGPLRGIKRDLTDGGIRVPLIARWPARIAAGSESDAIGWFADFLPTFAELAGVPDAAPHDLDGISLVPALTDRTAAHGRYRDRELYWAFYESGGGQALRAGKWKLIEQPIGSPLRLYNLDEDIAEQDDQAARHPDLVQQLRQQMRAAYQPSPHWEFPQR